MNLYILNYNNYYNRIVKKEESFEDYQKYVIYGPVLGVFGFTPGDGVNTVQVIGSNAQMYNGEGNYLIAVNSDNSINSRWFIIDSNRTRAGQHSLTLHRDLLVDFYDDIINAPAYIEKAIIPADNPLIFNDEQIVVNQIKTTETQLKDETNCAWIVGYYDNKILQTQPDIFNVNVPQETPYDVAVNSTFNEWEFYSTNAINGMLSTDIIFVNTKVTGRDYAGVIYRTSLNRTGYELSINANTIEDTGYNQGVGTPASIETIDSLLEDRKPEILSAINNEFDLPSSNTNINRLLSFDNKIVRFLDGEGGYVYYHVGVNNIPKTINQYVTKGSNLFVQLKDALNEYATQNWTAYAPNGNSFKINIVHDAYYVFATAVENSAVTTKITANANQLNDAPYSMFALPYPDEGKTFKVNNIEMTRQMSLSIANKLSIAGGSSIYDIQLLPYCPIRRIIQTTGDLSIEGLIYGQDYEIIKATGIEPAQVLGYIFFPQKSSFTLDIPLVNPVAFNDVKMRNQCDMWRLVSPNYNGQFEFNAMKMGGVNRFNVDCTYLPFQPYIHLNPDFSKLYGKDFNDARGLICGGDFSLTRETDAWEQYKIQNKNFQNIFDRQIENMEVQNKYNRKREIFNAATGVATGAATGVATGLLAGGGPVGAVVGGVAGAAASAVGGIADVSINEKLRNEALDYTQDLFNFSLDNIRALPQSISKTTAYTYNNKLYPILEYYTCTEEEKIAFANKIAYNSMTIMAMGKINDYIGNFWSWQDITDKGYIKCKLVRLDTSEDYHIVNAISGELNKGAYFKS